MYGIVGNDCRLLISFDGVAEIFEDDCVYENRVGVLGGLEEEVFVYDILVVLRLLACMRGVFTGLIVCVAFVSGGFDQW
jgi:hypothetical protein